MEQKEIQQMENKLDFTNEAIEKRIDFLKVEIKYDKAKAEQRYKEEYEQNINGMKNYCISFNQWILEREIEALSYTISLY